MLFRSRRIPRFVPEFDLVEVCRLDPSEELDGGVPLSEEPLDLLREADGERASKLEFGGARGLEVDGGGGESFVGKEGRTEESGEVDLEVGRGELGLGKARDLVDDDLEVELRAFDERGDGGVRSVAVW